MRLDEITDADEISARNFARKTPFGTWVCIEIGLKEIGYKDFGWILAWK
jgi:hypothetical protein